MKKIIDAHYQLRVISDKGLEREIVIPIGQSIIYQTPLPTPLQNVNEIELLYHAETEIEDD